MTSIKIVTDSAADVPADIAHDLGIEVVPLLLHIDDEVYRAGIDIADDHFYELLLEGTHRMAVRSPGFAVFEQTYRRLMVEYENILSVHVSGKLGTVVSAAQTARKRLPASTTHVEVIDGKSASMGIGSVVIAAAQAARDGAPAHDVIDLAHTMLQRTHVVFFVDTMEYLEQSGQLTLAASVIGSMQRIKPLMILDDGEIVPYERTRTRAKAIEGLFTFVEDFPHVEAVTVMYATTPEDVAKLLEKVEPIFPREQVEIARFGQCVSAHLGPGAMGVMVFEGLGEGLLRLRG